VSRLIPPDASSATLPPTRATASTICATVMLSSRMKSGRSARLHCSRTRFNSRRLHQRALINCLRIPHTSFVERASLCSTHHRLCARREDFFQYSQVESANRRSVFFLAYEFDPEG
jgi:hypothetical protein